MAPASQGSRAVFEELADDPVHLLDVGRHPGARRLVLLRHLDPEPQARERRPQVVRNAGEQQRPVLLELLQVRRHPVETVIELRDLGRAAFGQRRRRLAASHALHGGVQLAQRPREVAREAVGPEDQDRGEDQAPDDRAPRLVLDLRTRQREADPVARAGGFDANEEQAPAGRRAHLRIGAEPLLEVRLELLHLRRPRRARAHHRTLGLRDDPHAELAADAADRLASLAGIGRLERGTHGLQLRDLRVAERTDQQRRAIVAEDADRRRERERDHDQEQQREPPEQRTWIQSHVAGPAESSSGT